MARYSFIDYGNEDFLRNDNDEVVKIEASSHEEAEAWLLREGESYGFTNKGVGFWNWDE